MALVSKPGLVCDIRNLAAMSNGKQLPAVEKAQLAYLLSKSHSEMFRKQSAEVNGMHTDLAATSVNDQGWSNLPSSHTFQACRSISPATAAQAMTTGSGTFQ
jgi:hypothetical protein